MVVIRLSRGGSKGRPFFNIVVSDKRRRKHPYRPGPPGVLEERRRTSFAHRSAPDQASCRGSSQGGGL